jgi:hypothetical protein
MRFCARCVKRWTVTRSNLNVQSTGGAAAPRTAGAGRGIGGSMTKDGSDEAAYARGFFGGFALGWLVVQPLMATFA